MKNNLITYLIYLIIAFSFTSQIISQNNQNDEQSKEPFESKEEIITAVPVIEIPQKIEEAYVFISEIEALQIPSKPIEELEKEFNAILKKDSLLKVESTKEFIGNLTTRKLEDYDNKWNTYLNSISQYKKVLEDDATKITEIKDSYKNFDMSWDLTYENAKKEKAPKAIITRLNELNRDVKQIDKKLTHALNSILRLRDKVSTEELAAKEVITLIYETIKEHRSRLLSIDSPPIWVAISDSSDTTTLADRWTINKENVNKSFAEFYDIYNHIIIYYFIFFLVIFAFIYYLNNYARKNAESIRESSEGSVGLELLNKPFSISLLIVLFTADLFFPSAPRIVNEVFSILLLFPLLSLFPAYVSKETRGPLYFVTSIYLLQQILDLGPSSTVNARIVVIVLILLSIVAFILFMRIQISKIPNSRERFISFLSVMSKIMIVILSLSLIANLIGSTKLSKLVLSGVMSSIYYSLLLITGYQVFKVLLNVFLETRFANLFLLVKNSKTVIKRTLLKIAKIVAAVASVILILQGFGLYQFVLDRITEFLEISWKIGESELAVEDIILFFVAIWVSIKVSKFTRFILDGELLPRVNLPRGVPGAISLMTNYIIITFGLIFAFVTVGFDLSKFALIAGALGVGIGFGMQNIVNNFISGLILLFERPIQVGDVIGIQNLIGVVKRIGIRSSVISGWDGSEEIVPNADLVSFRVTNWTLTDRQRRIEIKIGTDFNSDPEQVIELLKYSISSRDDVMKEPAPYVLFEGYGESTLNFTFRFWIPDRADWIFVKSDVFLHIFTILKNAGIKIPYPQLDVKMKENGFKNPPNGSDTPNKTSDI